VRPSAAVSFPRSLVTTTPWAAAFSTTGANQRSDPGLGPRAKVMPGGHIRAGKRMQLGKFKKKTPTGHQGKSPLPGERKAYRKRIQLSNNNALPVAGLEELKPSDMTKSDNVGKVMSIPGPVLDQLRTVEAFKITQYWGMFRTPSTLLRTETAELTSRMKAAADKKEMLRLVISGDRITGKSLLMLQSLTHAFLNDWIVIHIPEGRPPPRLVFP